jgi:hypothetical protein
MRPMRIASIDYGQNTGIAIADRVDLNGGVVLNKYMIATYKDNIDSVLYWVKTSRCRSVILEQRPTNPNEIGLVTYEKIFNGLLALDFERAESIYKLYTLKLITPGNWKPVMKAQKQSNFGTWDPETDHEKDALQMLYYAIRIMEPLNVKVIYG